MPKGPKGQKRPADLISNAVLVMRIATGEVKERLTGGPGDKELVGWQRAAWRRFRGFLG
jgi:hypothetical protein